MINRARWLTDKYILVMLGLFPLFVGVRMHAYGNITASKFYFFAVATGLWAAASAVLVVIGRLRGERLALAVRPAHLAVAAFLAVSGLSACLSEYGAVCLMGASRYNGYLTYVLYCVVFYGVSFLAAPRRRYVWAFGASTALCCVIALLQLARLDPFWLYPEGTNYYDKYVAYNSAFLGTIGNVGLLAAYLCLSGPTLLGFALLSRRRVDRLLLIPGLLALVVLLTCDVDAGLVALAGGALVGVPMLLQRPGAARAAAFTSGGLTLAGLGGVYFWPGESGLLYELSQVLHGHLADEFGSHRGQIWKSCWALFREKPWLGGGPGTAALRIDIEWYSDVRGQAVRVNNAHNVYLGYLVDVGIPGLLCYGAALVCGLVTWFRRRGLGAIYPALGWGLLCYWIQDFFGLGLSLTAPMMFVVFGLLESKPPAAALAEGERSQEPG